MEVHHWFPSTTLKQRKDYVRNCFVVPFRVVWREIQIGSKWHWNVEEWLKIELITFWSDYKFYTFTVLNGNPRPEERRLFMGKREKRILKKNRCSFSFRAVLVDNDERIHNFRWIVKWKQQATSIEWIDKLPIQICFTNTNAIIIWCMKLTAIRQIRKSISIHMCLNGGVQCVSILIKSSVFIIQ